MWSARTVSLGYPPAFFISPPPLLVVLLPGAVASRVVALSWGGAAEGSSVCTMNGRLALALDSAPSIAACTADATASSYIKRT